MPQRRHPTLIVFARSLATSICVVAPLFGATGARGVEYGLSLYQLGLVAPSAAVAPAPGFYFWTTYLLYHGAGNLYEHAAHPSPARVSYDISANIAIFAWYSDIELLGGRIGVATTNAIGSETTGTSYWGVDGLGAPRLFAAQQGVSGFADSELTGILSWRSQDNHYKLTVSGFFPTGNYDPSRLAQTGLNRTALDVKGAYTFLGSTTGFEVSAALGLLLNGANSRTDYQSGAELHFEWSIGQHLPQGLYVGVGGYALQQVTPDAGAGAVYGGFKGRVAAAGPVLAYRYAQQGAEFTLSAKWYHEFANLNRVRGDMIYATLGFPLWKQPAPAVAAQASR
ncbi:transporter [Methylocella sp.]|uniref:SphA family protein n=1 Tax=Methylocella sp. TaxID=1978226 RepID=UPI00378315E9